MSAIVYYKTTLSQVKLKKTVSFICNDETNACHWGKILLKNIFCVFSRCSINTKMVSNYTHVAPELS